MGRFIKTLMSYSMPAALAQYVSDNFYIASVQADLDEAITLGRNIIIGSAVTLTANTTITTSLTINKGGSITTNGFTLTINGPFKCDTTQVFTAAAGEVVFGLGSIKEVLPEWFGAVGNNSTDCTTAFSVAIAAINGNIDGRIFVNAGIYRHTGITLGASQSLYGCGAKVSVLRFTPTTGNAITLSAGAANTSYNNIFDIKLDCLTTTTGKGICGPADPYYVADVRIDRYEIEGYLVGIYIPYGLHIEIGTGRLAGQGKAVANGVGVQLGDRTLGTPRLVNTGEVRGAYCSGYYTSFILDGSILGMTEVISENCTRALLFGCRCHLSNSWIQADTTLYETRAGGWTIGVFDCYHLNSVSAEVDDPVSMSTLAGGADELACFNGLDFKGGGQLRLRFATTVARGLRFGTSATEALYSESGIITAKSTGTRAFHVDRNNSGAVSVLGFYQQGVQRGVLSYSASGDCILSGASGNGCITWDTDQNVASGPGALSTSATNGFQYITTCAGTPTGVPTAKSGYVPLIVDTTNNKLYFYSGGAWRDAGP